MTFGGLLSRVSVALTAAASAVVPVAAVVAVFAAAAVVVVVVVVVATPLVVAVVVADMPVAEGSVLLVKFLSVLSLSSCSPFRGNFFSVFVFVVVVVVL